MGCVAPSIAIGVISTAFTDPGTAVGLLSTYGILGLVLMYLMANIALIAAGVLYMLVLQATRLRALSQAVSLLEGEVEAASGAT